MRSNTTKAAEAFTNASAAPGNKSKNLVHLHAGQRLGERASLDALTPCEIGQATNLAPALLDLGRRVQRVNDARGDLYRGRTTLMERLAME